MSEILTRLRGYNPPDRTHDSERIIAQDISDAADEIDRLRLALETATRELDRCTARAQVALDLHDAIGVRWGDNPYQRISALLAAERERDEARTQLARAKGEVGVALTRLALSPAPAPPADARCPVASLAAIIEEGERQIGDYKTMILPIGDARRLLAVAKAAVEMRMSVTMAQERECAEKLDALIRGDAAVRGEEEKR